MWMKHTTRPWLFMLALATALLCAASPVAAQSLDERLDEERYLKGLTDLQLPEVLEHYIDAFPSEDPVRAMQFRLAAERMAMQQPGTTPAQRLGHVEDILAARDKLKADGARVLGNGEPKIGAHGNPVLFLHPKDFNGTLVELEEVA